MGRLPFVAATSQSQLAGRMSSYATEGSPCQAIQVADFYTDLASDYHWLFSDDIVGSSPSLGATSPGSRALMADAINALPAGTSVLDCACGIGADAIALRNHGFTVTASDGSLSMATEARQRIAGHGADVNVVQSRWEELPEKVPGPFHLAICLGNSIVHTGTRSNMIRAFRGIRRVLLPGGILIVDSRNWELLYRSRARISPAKRVIERSGQRCCSLYVWSIPSTFNSRCHAEVILLFEDGEKKLTHRRYVLDFRPFGHDGLLNAITSAGFSVQDDSFQPESPFYAVAAVAI